jgi:hypothetical protein
MARKPRVDCAPAESSTRCIIASAWYRPGRKTYRAHSRPSRGRRSWHPKTLGTAMSTRSRCTRVAIQRRRSHGLRILSQTIQPTATLLRRSLAFTINAATLLRLKSMRCVCKRCFRTTNDREWNRIISFRYFATTLPEPFDTVGVKREIGSARSGSMRLDSFV